MEVNTDMKKALRGGYTFLHTWMLLQHKKRQRTLFLQVSQGCIYEREMGQFYQEKGFYSW